MSASEPPRSKRAEGWAGVYASLFGLKDADSDLRD